MLYIKSSIPYEAATVGGADPDGGGSSALTITLAVALPVAALAVGGALAAAVVLSRRDRRLHAAEATLGRLMESPACSSLGSSAGATPPGSLPPAAPAKPGSPPGLALVPQDSGASHVSSAAAGSLNELLAHVEQLAAAAATASAAAAGCGSEGARPLLQ
jgi:hypothetical protein